MKEELKSAFLNARFLLAFLLILSCFLGYSLPTWFALLDGGEEFREGALQLSVGGIFYGGAMLLLPFYAGTPHVPSQVDEIRTSFLSWKVFRSSVGRYARNKIIATMASSAAAAGLAFALHALAWNFIAFPYDVVAHPYQEIPFGSRCIFSAWADICYALPIYIWITVGIAFCASIWAVTGLAIAVWLPDKLLSIVIPVCIYNLWQHRIFYYVFGVRLPQPGALYNDALTVDWVWQSLVLYTLLFGVSVTAYVRGLRRRAQNA